MAGDDAGPGNLRCGLAHAKAALLLVYLSEYTIVRASRFSLSEREYLLFQ